MRSTDDTTLISLAAISVRTALVVLLVLSLLLAYVGTWWRSKARERELVRSLRESGALVYYEHQVGLDNIPIPDAIPREPSLLSTMFGDDFFEDVAYVHAGVPPGIELIDFPSEDHGERALLFDSQGTIDHSQLKKLSEFPALRCVNLELSTFDEVAIAELAACPALKKVLLPLNFPDDKIDAMRRLLPECEVEKRTSIRDMFDRLRDRFDRGTDRSNDRLRLDPKIRKFWPEAEG